MAEDNVQDALGPILKRIQERLTREYDLDLITTAPSVVYEVEKADGEVIQVRAGDDALEVGKATVN